MTPMQLTDQKEGEETWIISEDSGLCVNISYDLELSTHICSIRHSTLLRLRLLSLPGFRLSDIMRDSLAQDPLAPLAPLLSEGNLSALDRRLASVLQAVQTCQEHHTDVIYNDLEGYDTINSMHEEQNNKWYIQDSRLLLSFVHSYSVDMAMEILGHRLLQRRNIIKQTIKIVQVMQIK